jgi:hypothetical protein
MMTRAFFSPVSPSRPRRHCRDHRHSRRRRGARLGGRGRDCGGRGACPGNRNRGYARRRHRRLRAYARGLRAARGVDGRKDVGGTSLSGSRRRLSNRADTERADYGRAKAAHSQKTASLSAWTTTEGRAAFGADICGHSPRAVYSRDDESPVLAGLSMSGRYWARTSDPQLVESLRTATGCDRSGQIEMVARDQPCAVRHRW